MTTYKFKDTPVEQQAIIIHQLTYLQELYPAIEVRYVSEADMRQRKSYAIAQYARRSIIIDPKAISGLTKVELEWIISHEFGHHLHFSAGDHGYNTVLARHTFDLPEPLVEQMRAIKESATAHYNYADEWFAEGFAYMVSTSDEQIATHMEYVYNVLKG